MIKSKETPLKKNPGKPVSAAETGKSEKAGPQTPPKKKSPLALWWKEALLMLVNVVFIVMTFIYLAKLPGKANEVKEQRNSSGVAKATLNLDLSKFEVETAKEKFDKLNGLFPDQKKLLDFIGAVDGLKTTGNVTNFAFASDSVVKEKSGYIGYPFVIEFRGTTNQIADGLEKFQKLPFLFKTVNFSLEKSDLDGSVTVRYGGFLYVSETTSKN